MWFLLNDWTVIIKLLIKYSAIGRSLKTLVLEVSIRGEQPSMVLVFKGKTTLKINSLSL